jgi:hypothetical protein
MTLPSVASRLLIPVLLAVATAAPAATSPAFKAGVFEPPRQAPEFALRGSDGAELTLARYRGKVVMLSFGFTHCAAVCPVTLATLAEARRALGSAADSVKVVFVTVDPERAPAQLRATWRPSMPLRRRPGHPRRWRRCARTTASCRQGADDRRLPMDHVVRLPDRPRRQKRAMMPYGGRGLCATSSCCWRSDGRPCGEGVPARRRTFATALALLLATLVAVALAWAALAPIELASRDELFEIPRGTWARRMAGDKVEILPDTIRLTLGINDVLLLRNLDDVPQVFGPALIMPGQSFRLPFEVASSYSFACTAHAKGAMSVIVDPSPAKGWPTLRWRARQWLQRSALIRTCRGAGA